MTFSTFGDLASTFQIRSLNAQLKQDLTRLGMELSTGQKSDISSTVTGDFGPISAIEHSLKLIESQERAANAAEMRTSVAQLSLETVQTQLQDLSEGVLSAAGSRNATLMGTTSADARQKFSSILSNLNTQAAGRSVFAGAATDSAALADSEVILSSILAAVSGETTAAGVAAAIDLWYDTPGGGFETIAYIGSTNDLGEIQLGNGEVAEMPVRADDQEIRNILKAVTKTLVVSEGVLDASVDEQAELFQIATTDSLSAVEGLTMLRAHVGAVEARIENTHAQMASEKSTLELSRNKIIAADPYETATALQALYGQVESLYTVTARLSQLNFTDYMR